MNASSWLKLETLTKSFIVYASDKKSLQLVAKADDILTMSRSSSKSASHCANQNCMARSIDRSSSHPCMDEFISYMEDTWIAGMFPINMWNVYQATGPHTNNRDHILIGFSYLVYASVTDSCKRFGHVAIQKIKRCGFVGKVTRNVNLDTG